MLQDLAYHFLILNAAVRSIDDDLHLFPALLTFLYFYAERRPVKTRFRRCALKEQWVME